VVVRAPRREATGTVFATHFRPAPFPA